MAATGSSAPGDESRRRSRKRANGQGSIYQRKDGRWTGAAYVLTADGTYKRVQVYGTTASEVSTKLMEVKSRSDRGLPTTATGWTVGAYADYWLEHVAAPKLRPTTMMRYRVLLSQYVVPSLGKKRLVALTPADVRLMLAKVTVARTPGRKGQRVDERPLVSARTVQSAHGVLRSMLSQAMREELVSRNVAKLVQPPRPQPKEVEPWTDAEARTFLAASRDHRLYALFVVALGMGLRKGELLGLRWVDVELASHRLRVAQALQNIKGVGVVYGPPKSRQSRRVLSVPAFVAEALSRHRRLQDDERRAAGDSWEPSGLVFTTRTGNPLGPHNVHTLFRRLIVQADVRQIRFHDMRHTCASLLLSRGVPARMVMDILGHSQISVTMNTYAHVMPAMQSEAAGHMDVLLGNEGGHANG